MNTLSVLGKYLDQPMVVAKFTKAVPYVLIGGGAAYTISHVAKTPQREKKNELIKTISVLTATIGSALLAPRIASRIIKSAEAEIPLGLAGLKKQQTELIDAFLLKNKVKPEVEKVLETAKTNILNFPKLKTLCAELSGKAEGKEFLDELVPGPENVDSRHIFGEIGRLSIIGLIPVLGGVLGGIFGDKLTEKKWKEKIPNKIKEGAYQYLANIFLCNVGAGGALYLMEKAKIQSKSARATGMIAGIVATGVLGGSAIANFIGKTCINPFVGKKDSQKEGLYSERKPELLDVGLHVDDIATVAVMSGLKWIEPALPILYSISGFRAGIGYRNGDDERKFYQHASNHSFQSRYNKKEVFSAFS